MSRLLSTISDQLARRGFVVRRHPGTRRQTLFDAHGVNVVFDVGAARGGYANELRAHGFTGDIVSFEPLAAAYADLAATSAGDTRWQVHHTALGAETGTAEINVASNSDSSSLLPMHGLHRQASPDITYTGTETIQVSRLDDLAPQYLHDDVTPFLKIDTQGFERSVLEGAADTLPRLRGLQLELSFVPLYEGGMLADEAIGWVYDQGFVLAALDQGFTDPGGALLQADGIFLRR